MDKVRKSLTLIGPKEPKIIVNDVYIASLEPKSISKILNWIKNAIPFHEFVHLKRVKKEGDRMLIIICKVSEIEKYESVLKEKNFDFSKFEVYKLPMMSPTTSKDFEKWNKVWPLSKPITNTDIEYEEYINRLKNEELEKSVKFMSKAFEEANHKECVSNFY